MPTTSAQIRSHGPGYMFCSMHGVLISLQTLPLCRSHRIQSELCLLPRFLLSCPSRLAAWGSCCPHRCSRRSDRAPPFDVSWKKANEATSFSSSENPSWVCFLFGGLFLAHGSPTRPPLQWSPEIKKQTKAILVIKQDINRVFSDRADQWLAMRWHFLVPLYTTEPPSPLLS